MSFSSLIFIALFLPVFMIASVLVRGNQRKNLLLLLFSLIFYAFAGLTKLALLLMMTMLAWFIGQRIGHALQFAASENPDYQEGDDDFQSPDAERTRVEGQKRARAWLLLALVLLIAVLLFYKLAGPCFRPMQAAWRQVVGPQRGRLRPSLRMSEALASHSAFPSIYLS